MIDGNPHGAGGPPKPRGPIFYMTPEQRARFLAKVGLPMGWHLVTVAELDMLDRQTKIYAAERPALIEKAWVLKDALNAAWLAIQGLNDDTIEDDDPDLKTTLQTIKEAAEIPLPMRPPAPKPASPEAPPP